MDETKHEEQNTSEEAERNAEATDSRTLEEIEEQQQVPGSKSNTPTPSPDAGANHVSGNEDAGDPM